MHYVTVHLLFCWAHEKTSMGGSFRGCFVATRSPQTACGTRLCRTIIGTFHYFGQYIILR
jgi:hypothetical protein